jgi:dihydroorotate dehydrogenase electron transfer subunit
MSKRIEDFQVIDIKHIKNEFFVLELLSPGSLPEILPGQFVQARIDGSSSTFLRRPFSVHDVNYRRNTIRILVQVVGHGTGKMSQMVRGDTINLVYPLGNSFSLPENGEKSLLIGGGCGIAPLLYLSGFIRSKGYEQEILVGFRNKERIIEYEEYRKYGKVHVATEDGSEGEKGLVTDHSVFSSGKFDRFYCCGPDLMMKSVASYAASNNIRCEVSLENLMACGLGVCLCCIVKTTRGNVCSCTEGPVFNINELKW